MNKDVVEYQKDLANDHILKIREVIRQNEQCYLITDYCAYGQVCDYLYSTHHFDEENALIFFTQIIDLYQYLTDKKILYYQLNVVNTFIGENGCIKCFGIFPDEFKKPAGSVHCLFLIKSMIHMNSPS